MVRARHAFAAAVVGTLLIAAAGCGGDDAPPVVAPEPAEALPRPSAEPVPEPRCTSASSPLGGRGVAYGALVVRVTTARHAPGGAPMARFGRRNVNGVPTVLGVLAARRNEACVATWYRVQLPVRPNGAVGWVRAADVELRRVTTRILVDLSDRRVTLFRRGEKVLETTAAIGQPGTPTPTGSYYVNQRLLAPDPAGPFGPGAVGISAFSPTLQGWAQGGPIAIHGTNTPHRLGLAVSHGCVRIANADLLRLYELAEEGTPVLIRS